MRVGVTAPALADLPQCSSVSCTWPHASRRPATALRARALQLAHACPSATGALCAALERPALLLSALQGLGRPPMRCIVVGASNLSTEAAHEAGMQSLSVAGRHPVYELTAADLVVSNLGDVTMMNLKQLFASEEGVAWQVGGRSGMARARRDAAGGSLPCGQVSGSSLAACDLSGGDLPGHRLCAGKRRRGRRPRAGDQPAFCQNAHAAAGCPAVMSAVAAACTIVQYPCGGNLMCCCDRLICLFSLGQLTRLFKVGFQV